MSPSQRATRGADRPSPPARPVVRPRVRRPASPAVRAGAPDSSYTAPSAASMRASSPSSVGARAVGVAASEHEPPAPQPFGLRDARISRSRSLHTGVGVDGEAEREAHRAQRGRGPRRIDAGAETHWRLAGFAGEQQAELAALGRFERAERAAQQRDHVGRTHRVPTTTATGRRGRAGRRRGAAPCRCRRGTPRRTRRRPPAACRTRAPGRAGARPRAASQSPASCSRRVARPWTSPWARPSASCPSTSGRLGVPRRMIDQRQRGLHAAQALDHHPRRVVVERCARRRRRRRARARPSRRTPCATPTRRWRARRRSAGPGRADRAPPSAGRRRDRWRPAPRAGRRSARPQSADAASNARSRAAASSSSPSASSPARRAGWSPPARPSCRARRARRGAPTARAPTRPATSRGTSRSCRGPPRAHPIRRRGRRAGAGGATWRSRSACAGRARPRARRPRGLSRTAPLPGEQVAGERHLRRAVGDLADRLADDQPPPHERQPAHHGVGGVEHLVETGTRPAAQHRQRLGHPRRRR